MPAGIERALRQYFKKDILNLQDCIQRDFSMWFKKEPA